MFTDNQERMYLARVFLGASLLLGAGSMVDHVLDSGQSSVALAAGTELRNAFGYKIGEERRYVLEPADSLPAGDSAWWSIVLRDIQGAGDDTRIIFDIEHERTEIIHDIFGGVNGRMQMVKVGGRLTVNRFGFPERLTISEKHDLYGEVRSGSDTRTTLFFFDGERFVKQVRINGVEWAFNIAIANHDDLDLGGPTGLYAYVPTALHCLGARSEPGRPARCPNGDPAFANPGLLSLALPVMWEEQVNEKKFLFFMPSGFGTVPGGLMDMNRLKALERDQIGNYTRYYRKTDLKIKEHVQDVEIGPRFVDAWLLDGSGSMRDFYIQPDGKVLKVLIDAHPRTHGERWIRLLFPSEY